MDVLLPLLGDVMTEGTVTSWFQADGAYVREGEPLYQVETDKVNLAVDSPQSGVLERVVREGETVPVGAVVARLVAVGATAGAANASVRREGSGRGTLGLAEDAFATRGSVAAEAGGRGRKRIRQK